MPLIYWCRGIKSYYKHEGHKVIDHSVIWNVIINGVCVPIIKFLSLKLMVQKLVKVDNRQDKNNMPLIIQSGGIKICILYLFRLGRKSQITIGLDQSRGDRT